MSTSPRAAEAALHRAIADALDRGNLDVAVLAHRQLADVIEGALDPFQAAAAVSARSARLADALANPPGPRHARTKDSRTRKGE
jgi:hypothetical protein